MGRSSIREGVQRIDGGRGGDLPRSTALALDVLDVLHPLDTPDALDAIDGAGRALLDLGCGVGHQARRPDARDFDLGTAARFDVVYSFYDTLNHILDPADLLSIFRCVRHTLRPGGTALEREGDPDVGEGVGEIWVRRDAHVRERCHRTDEVSAALRGAGFADVFQTSAEDAGMERSLHRGFFVAR